MIPEQVYANLPPIHQKVAVLVLALLGALWIANMVRKHRFKEEHALIWFLGLASAAVLVWCDPLLAGLTVLVGADVPASALVLATVFFLFVVAVYLTSEVSRQKEEIARLVIHLSVMKAKLSEETAKRTSEPPPHSSAPPPHRSPDMSGAG
jgi:hypothetical protein